MSYPLPPQPHQGGRLFIKVAAAVVLGIGVIMLVRGYSLTQPPTTATSTLGATTSRPANNLQMNLAGVAIPPAGGRESIWGEVITDPRSVPTSAGVWVYGSNAVNTFWGELKFEGWQLQYELDTKPRAWKLFNNKYLWTLTDVVNAGSKLVGTNPEEISLQSLLKLYDFKTGQYIQDIWFEPTRREFYYIYGDSKTNISNLSILKPNGTVQSLFTSNYYKFQDLLDINPNQNLVYFYGTNEDDELAKCYRLQLLTKDIAAIDCAWVNTNGFIKDVSLAAADNTGAVPVVRIDRNAQTITTLVPATTGMHRQYLSLRGDLAAWYEVSPAGKSVQVHNLATNTNVRSITDLPEGDVLDVGLSDKLEVIILVRTSTGQWQVYWEVTNNSSSTATSSISATSTVSTTSSAAETDVVITTQPGWKIFTFTQCTVSCQLQFIKQ
jgi:hypothetical protein